MGGLADRIAQRAKAASEALKAEYEAGKRGDGTPAQPIWPTPRQQLETLSRLMGKRGPAASDVPTPSGDAPAGSATGTESKPAEPTDAELDEVAAQLTSVDWDAVRSAVSDKSSDVAHAARSMAQNVDWAKVQPVAAQVSTALIAAVAAGRLPLAGRLGPIIAQAIAGQSGVGQRLANRAPVPVRRDLSRTILDVNSTELTAVTQPVRAMPAQAERHGRTSD